MHAEGFDVLTSRKVPAENVDPGEGTDLTYLDDLGLDGGEVLTRYTAQLRRFCQSRSTSWEKCKASNAARRDTRPDRRSRRGPRSLEWWVVVV
jgi:hypothetical protein